MSELHFTTQANRLKFDFERGHRLGEKSTARLLDLVLQMAQELDELRLERRTARGE
jgi:hypothetical protein